MNTRTPLVYLLECYVLWAIGELAGEQAAILSEMTPSLRSVYRASGDWHDVIAAAMRWPRGMPRRIRAAWDRNANAARGGRAAAEVFAAAYVEAHFVGSPTSLRPIREAPDCVAASQRPKPEII